MTQPLPVPHPQVLFTQIDDGSGVLLHLDTKFYFTLNRTGVAVWNALAEGTATSIEALGARLASEFRVDAASATRDAAGLIEELHADGLVQQRAP